MPTPKKPKDIHVFNGIAQYYWCFIKDFAFIMVPITKLLQKIEAFEWTNNLVITISSQACWQSRLC
jgi:hypothetical protein